jgi:hypothetical protein
MQEDRFSFLMIVCRNGTYDPMSPDALSGCSGDGCRGRCRGEEFDAKAEQIV